MKKKNIAVLVSGGGTNLQALIDAQNSGIISSGKITLDIAKFSLEALNIDKFGLDEIDNKILSIIIDKFKGGPVGVNTIATALGEDSGTLEEVYEPFLIKEGFIKRTPRGREVTELAYKHLGRTPLTQQGTLFEL